jgi:hypothetical protein
VLIGVDRKGALKGQDVSENTFHEITQAFERFAPPANVTIERTALEGGREVLALSVTSNQESVPFTHDGRAFVRVGNATRRNGRAMVLWITEPMAMLYGLTGKQAYLDYVGMINDTLEMPDKGAHAHGYMANLRGLQKAALITGDADARFDSTLGAWGQCPALFNWFAYTGPRERVLLAANVTGRDMRRDGSGQIVTGIDLFRTTLLHENRHVTQVLEHNALNPWDVSVGGARIGWSFSDNAAPQLRTRANIQAGRYNHFQAGPDGQPGVAGGDDDGDWVRGGADAMPGVAGVDEDGDGQADDVAGPWATPEVNQANGVDDDGDGVVDDGPADPAGRPVPYGAGDDHDLNNNGIADAGDINVDEADEFVAGAGDTVVGDDVDLDPDGDRISQ